METGNFLAYTRVVFCLMILWFIRDPLSVTVCVLFSVILFKIWNPFCQQSFKSVIINKCISDMPSLVLNIIMSYYDKDHRFEFFIIGIVLYLNI